MVMTMIIMMMMIIQCCWLLCALLAGEIFWALYNLIISAGGPWATNMPSHLTPLGLTFCICVSVFLFKYLHFWAFIFTSTSFGFFSLWPPTCTKQPNVSDLCLFVTAFVFVFVLRIVFVFALLDLITKMLEASKSFCDRTPLGRNLLFCRIEIVLQRFNQTWLTCWLSLQPFVALQRQTDHSSVIGLDQNCRLS